MARAFLRGASCGCVVAKDQFADDMSHGIEIGLASGCFKLGHQPLGIEQTPAHFGEVIPKELGIGRMFNFSYHHGQAGRDAGCYEPGLVHLDGETVQHHAPKIGFDEKLVSDPLRRPGVWPQPVRRFRLR